MNTKKLALDQKHAYISPAAAKSAVRIGVLNHSGEHRHSAVFLCSQYSKLVMSGLYGASSDALDRCASTPTRIVPLTQLALGAVEKTTTRYFAMSNTALRTGAPAKKLPTNTTPEAQRIQSLEFEIADIQAIISAEYLSRIDAIAFLTTQAMKTPNAYYNPESIAVAIESIRHFAQEAQHYIEVVTEKLGIEVFTGDKEERFEAHRKAIGA